MSSAPRFAFHFAYLVHDLNAARRFYGELLGCEEGRSTDQWVDFDFHGHQLSLHLREGYRAKLSPGSVDSEAVPMPHFGLVFDQDTWQSLADRLKKAGQTFIVAPHTRFEGEPGEQSTMFLLDPSGNALEFKGFRDLSRVFAAEDARNVA